MDHHYHFNVEQGLFYAGFTILVINLLRIGAGLASKRPEPIAKMVGGSVASIV